MGARARAHAHAHAHRGKVRTLCGSLVGETEGKKPLRRASRRRKKIKGNET
jgi:hypothetical protein